MNLIYGEHGVLHMGHMLNNTIQDVLVRRARMLGKNACWVPGVITICCLVSPTRMLKKMLHLLFEILS